MPVEQWKYNMCNVALLAMPGRGLATLVRAEVVTGGDTVTVTQQHPARGRTAHPGHAGPALARNIGAEEKEVSSRST